MVVLGGSCWQCYDGGVRWWQLMRQRQREIWCEGGKKVGGERERERWIAGGKERGKRKWVERKRERDGVNMVVQVA